MFLRVRVLIQADASAVRSPAVLVYTSITQHIYSSIWTRTQHKSAQNDVILQWY